MNTISRNILFIAIFLTLCSLSLQTTSNTRYHVTCNIGSYYNANRCYKCPYDCAYCQDGSTCNQCFDGYYLQNGTCLPCSENCTICKSDTFCTHCDLYHLSFTDGSCRDCSLYLPNCSACDNINKCTVCTSGYSLASSGGGCVQSIAGCTSYTADGNCSSCDSGYFPNNGICTLCGSGCIECESKTQCYSCSGGYYMQNQTCYACTVSHCVSCSNGTQCDSCGGFYKVNDQGTCSFDFVHFLLFWAFVIWFLCCGGAQWLSKNCTAKSSPNDTRAVELPYWEYNGSRYSSESAAKDAQQRDTRGW